jgi:CRISPR-associated protein (TIGR02584 family)
MLRPVHYRNVFLFVSGRTPQIITETLFFFLTQSYPAIRPHEIHVLTTTEGQALIRNQLLVPKTGKFHRFCRAYGLESKTINFSEQTVKILRDERGTPLADIRTNADNRAAADQIVATVRTLTNDPHTRPVASMAGGRKTMGLYLGFALQFYGRPQDRLTHVLINPPKFENNPRFFYPAPQRGSSSALRSRTPKQTATVTVAEVPLILLAHKLPVLRDWADLSYATLVTQSQREVDLLATPLPLTIDRIGRQLRVGKSLISLSGLEFAFYYLVAHKRRQASCPSDCPGCTICTVRAADFLDSGTISSLENIATEVGIRDPRLQQLQWWAAESGGKERFLQTCARIKQKIRAVLGEASGPYSIAPLHARQERTALAGQRIDSLFLASNVASAARLPPHFSSCVLHGQRPLWLSTRNSTELHRSMSETTTAREGI